VKLYVECRHLIENPQPHLDNSCSKEEDGKRLCMLVGPPTFFHPPLLGTSQTWPMKSNTELSVAINKRCHIQPFQTTRKG
jgi:hypothetical protein